MPSSGGSTNIGKRDPDPANDLSEIQKISDAGTSIHMSDYPIERAAHTVNKAKAYAANVAAAATQPSHSDLNTSVASVSSRFRHENQNSIYYLRPRSTEIYILDFEQKGFVKE